MLNHVSKPRHLYCLGSLINKKNHNLIHTWTLDKNFMDAPSPIKDASKTKKLCG